MPELPDVEYFLKKIRNEKLENKKIKDIIIFDDSIIKSASKKKLKNLNGKTFQKAFRYGKYIIFEINGILTAHFGMTGFVETKNRGEAKKYEALRIVFDNNSISFYTKRKLGKIEYYDNFEDFKQKKNLGEDVLSISKENFKEKVKQSNSYTKTLFMNQSNMAGLGNIYSDEILYHAHIHPKKRTRNLNNKEINNIFDKMHYIIKEATMADAQPSKMPKDFLIHYRKKGQKCPNCKGTIEKIEVGSRSTYFCPNCQS